MPTIRGDTDVRAVITADTAPRQPRRERNGGRQWSVIGTTMHGCPKAPAEALPEIIPPAFGGSGDLVFALRKLLWKLLASQDGKSVVTLSPIGNWYKNAHEKR
jgi:hypothetical protein